MNFHIGACTPKTSGIGKPMLDNGKDGKVIEEEKEILEG